VNIFAGQKLKDGNVNGTKLEAAFKNPWHIAIDKLDNIFVADHGNHVIRKINNQGEIIC
jgi:hypothetical protein